MNWLRKILGIEQQNNKIDEIILIAKEIQNNKRDNNTGDLASEKINELQEKIDNIASEIIRKEFNPNFELVDPLDISKRFFEFELLNSSQGTKKKIDANTESFLRNLGSSFPEMISIGVLSKSYRFVFPQGVSGAIMKMPNGQGTAIMQSGKILKHGGYVSNLAVAAPLVAINIGSFIIRQHYLAKINDNLNQISLKVNQLLELEFIKKHSQIESIIYFFQKAHQEYNLIESNSEYRNAYLTNIIRLNIDLYELIQFYKKSFKFLEREKTTEIELNLQYFLALHGLYLQGKLLELKYAQEHNPTLIFDLKIAFEKISVESLEFLKENQMDIYYKVLDSENSKSVFDKILLRAEKKDKIIQDLKNSKSRIIEAMEIQREEISKVSSQLTEFSNNLNLRKEFIIEKGELYEILE
ncbi:hypothetical protein [Flavobacterium caeni]|uniref:Uncharacterized protein n=1 Tax=Flavobacterium caeni TaxID=490189 RepID=A0A1G5KLN2_9FLAO|nr:hypothetical protein [Flavobacterium caeni]SCZ01525.1 hypothetical protein SAMN02927903_03373 [Flavobacterium caeni]